MPGGKSGGEILTGKQRPVAEEVTNGEYTGTETENVFPQEITESEHTMHEKKWGEKCRHMHIHMHT